MWNNREDELKSSVSSSALYGLGAIGLGGVASLLYFIGDPRTMVTMLIGIVVVGAIMGGYMLILRLVARRRAGSFGSSLGGELARTPTSLKDPNAKAKLDSLRKNFMGGFETFRACGKDPYSLPWYVVVGEPGGGKTEAIRHCGIGFPPGLQDEYQGVGGTINMNWWFTNHAVILDTAGRLVFEDVDPTTTAEWREFLRLLRQNRRFCPINGLMLVIPAETLLEDTVEKIREKAGKIARQLDLMQRTLMVRFPVFVVITKADKIPGFRDFFDELADARYQEMAFQMLGWSNPADLDAVFDPTTVDTHLDTVRTRLSKRRLGLLLDPVARKGQKQSRTDEVDALFAFPEAVKQMSPRLRQYLETIFMPGQWSAKPLFLRGIYFTSSMQEGLELDRELAAELGTSLDHLADVLGNLAALETKKRSYFLRDMFTEKVFPERGLVTSASNTSSLKRRRRLAVLGTSMVGVLGLIGFTWYGSTQLRESIGTQRDFWQTAAAQLSEKPEEWRVMAPHPTASGQFVYRGGNRREIPPGQLRTLAELYGSDATRAGVDAPINVPWIFRPAAGFETDLLRGERRRAFERMFARGVLEPVLGAARGRLAGGEPGFSPAAVEALAELLRAERLLALGESPDTRGPLQVEPLLRFAMEKPAEMADEALAEAEQIQADGPALQRTLAWLYASDAGGAVWPPASLELGSAKSLSNLRTACERLVRARLDGLGQDAELNQRFAALLAMLEQLDTAEADLWRLDDDGQEILTSAAMSSRSAEWQRAAVVVFGIERRLSEALASPLLRDRLADPARLFGDLEAELVGAPAAELDRLIKLAVPRGSGRLNDDHGLVACHGVLDQGRGRLLEAARKRLSGQRSSFEALAARHLAPLTLDGEQMAAFRLRTRLYRMADEQLRLSQDANVTAQLLAAPLDFDSAVSAVRSRCAGELARMGSVDRGLSPAAIRDTRLDQARPLSEWMVRAAQRAGLAALVERLVDLGAAEQGSAGEIVRSAAAMSAVVPRLPTIPLWSSGSVMLDAAYTPEPAGRLFALRVQLEQLLAQRPDPVGAGEVLDAARLRERTAGLMSSVDSYTNAYAMWWLSLWRGASVQSFETWEAFRGAMLGGDVTPIDLLRGLTALAEMVDASLRVAPAARLSAEAQSQADDLRFAVTRMKDPRYEQQLGQMLGAWKQLSSLAPDAARQRLLGLTAASFVESYLAAQGSRVYFVDSLASGALDLLVRSGSSRHPAQDDLDRLLGGYRKFPLARDAVESLSAEEFEQAARLVLSLHDKLLAARAQGTDAPATTIGTGQLTGRGQAFDEPLQRLRPDTPLARDELAWLARVHAIVQALQPAAELLNAELSVIEQPARAPGNQPGWWNQLMPLGQRYQYADLFRGNTRLNDTRLFLAVGRRAATLDVASGDWSFRFYRNEADAAPAGQTRPGRSFDVLARWLEAGEPLEGTQASATSWRIPLRVADLVAGEQREFVWWIGIRLIDPADPSRQARSLPARNLWPMLAEWPRPARGRLAGEPAAALARLTQLSGFPLCVDSTRVLSAAQLRQARADLDALAEAGAVPGLDGPWLASTRGLAAAFTADPAPMVTLTLLGDADQPAASPVWRQGGEASLPAFQRYQYVDLLVGGKEVLKGVQTRSRSGNRSASFALGSELELRFYEALGRPTGAVVRLSGPASPLNSLGLLADVSGVETGGVWRVPLIAEEVGANDRRHHFVVQITVDPPLPQLSTWPAAAGWPK